MFAVTVRWQKSLPDTYFLNRTGLKEKDNCYNKCKQTYWRRRLETTIEMGSGTYRRDGAGSRRLFDLSFTTYYRLPDDQALKVKHQQSAQFKPGQTYTAMTYNIGYGSYPPSYSFFMDGGKYSRAYSQQAVRKSINGVIKTTQAQKPDIAFIRKLIRMAIVRGM